MHKSRLHQGCACATTTCCNHIPGLTLEPKRPLKFIHSGVLFGNVFPCESCSQRRGGWHAPALGEGCCSCSHCLQAPVRYAHAPTSMYLQLIFPELHSISLMHDGVPFGLLPAGDPRSSLLDYRPRNDQEYINQKTYLEASARLRCTNTRSHCQIDSVNETFTHHLRAHHRYPSTPG